MGCKEKDSLTGLPIWAKFKEIIMAEYEARTNFATLHIDIDRISMLNARHGFQVGDSYITDLANVIREKACAFVMLSRISGDEFGVMLKGVTREEAKICAMMLTRYVEDHFLMHDFPLTVSIGVVHSRDVVSRNVDDHMRLSMQRVENAKDGGRNQVSIAGLLEEANPRIVRQMALAA